MQPNSSEFVSDNPAPAEHSDTADLLRDLAISCRVPVVLAGRDGCIATVNAAAARDLNAPIAALVGRNVEEQLERAGENPWQRTWICDGDRRICGAIWMRVESAVSPEDASRYESAEFLRDVIETDPTAIFVKDRQGRYVFVNHATAVVFGRPAAAIVGRTDAELANRPSEAPAIHELDLRVLDSGTEIHTMTEQLSDATGRVRHWETWKRPLPDRSGRCDHILGAAVDRTRQVEIEQELRRNQAELENHVRARTAELQAANNRLANEIVERMVAEKEARSRQDELAHASRLCMIGELAAEIAHEVGQPLTAIVNYVLGCQRRLQSGQWNAGELESALNAVLTQASLATQIVRRMRNFLQKAEPARRPVEVQAILLQSIGLLEYEANRIGVRVTVDCAADLPTIFVDEIQIQQVLMNLLRNAFDAVSTVENERRRVSITARRSEANMLEICVEDAGIGLPPGGGERLLEPFVTSKPGGLGLGLSICRGIVVAHGGAIALIPKDCGARAVITLPRIE